MAEIRARFAPSPTGNPHIGNIRTALFTYLFSRSQKGVFILRIEDTDKKREIKESYQAIIDSLRWLGLNWDEGPQVHGPYGPYVQSQRTKIYRHKAEELVEKGAAYYCFCSSERLEKVRQEARAKKINPRYDRTCRILSEKEVKTRLSKGEKPVIRLKVPEKGKITYHDLVHGDISFDLSEVDDQILLKSDGYPTYHLANVVDDHLMKITHVTRGDDWVSSVPKHLVLYQSFGWEPPKFAHFPLILGPDKAKLSKRHGAVGVLDFRKMGYLPEAVINYLVLLGWAPPGDQEIFSLSELIKEFKLENINKANPVFSYQKLDWFNGFYIREKSNEEFLKLIKPYAPSAMSGALINQSIPLIKERIIKLSDYPNLIDFFIKEPKVDIQILVKKGGGDRNLIKEQFQTVIEKLQRLSGWQAESLEKLFRNLAQERNYHIGKFFMAVRIALTGKTATPPLFETMEILGSKKTLNRLSFVVKSF